MSNNNQEEIVQDNNPIEEKNEDIEIQQKQNANKKKAKKKINKLDTTKVSKTEDNINNNTNNNNSINDNKTNAEEIPKNKSNIKLIIKEQNELLTKEREYLQIIENLKLKIKNIEESNKDELEKIISENNEKENRIKILASTNEKMKQSYDALLQRMKQLENNITKKAEAPKDANSGEKPPQEISDKDKEIKIKQKYINLLSKKNQDMKKSIDRFYELDINKNIEKELKEKEQLKIKLENEIKKHEEIVDQHNKKCSVTIKKLKEELNDIEKKLSLENSQFHDKNKDYILMQCKLSLFNKEKEEEYKKLQNKKKFLDMEKHNDFLSYNPYYNKNSFSIQMYNKKKEFSRDLEKGIKSNYERSVSLPKINTNNEKKVISELFTEKEMANLKKLFMDELNDEKKYENFLKKINDLEKGNFIDETSFDDLNEECSQLEKEIIEIKEILSMEDFKKKRQENENSELNYKYKNLYRKNIILKREEKKLKNDLEEKNKKDLIKNKQEKHRQEIDKMLNDVNKIYLTEQDNSKLNSYPNKNNTEKNNLEKEENINNENINEENNNINENGEEYYEQNNNEEEGQEGEGEAEGEAEAEGEMGGMAEGEGGEEYNEE